MLAVAAEEADLHRPSCAVACVIPLSASVRLGPSLARAHDLQQLVMCKRRMRAAAMYISEFDLSEGSCSDLRQGPMQLCSTGAGQDTGFTSSSSLCCEFEQSSQLAQRRVIGVRGKQMSHQDVICTWR